MTCNIGGSKRQMQQPERIMEPTLTTDNLTHRFNCTEDIAENLNPSNNLRVKQTYRTKPKDSVGAQQCGDWKIMSEEKEKCCFNKTLTSICNMTEESLHQPITHLPDLPINFDDPKSVDTFLENNSPLVKILLHVRKPIAGYQEAKGIMKQNASLTFSALLHALYLNTSSALCTIAMLLYNLMPLLDVALFIIRFVIDKTIEIVDTNDRYDFYMKSCIFLCEVFLVSILILVLSSIIIFPIVSLASHILYRAVHIIT